MTEGKSPTIILASNQGNILFFAYDNELEFLENISSVDELCVQNGIIKTQELVNALDSRRYKPLQKEMAIDICNQVVKMILDNPKMNWISVRFADDKPVISKLPKQKLS